MLALRGALPGGRRDEQETLSDTAARELREETAGR
ncbi:NUDIX hydrolase [Cupriavidus yeoncheonensis]